MANGDGLTRRTTEARDPAADRGVMHATGGAVRTVGGALLGWWQATTLDALIVGALWWVGLSLLHVPLAPLWALLGGLCQFVPGVGAALGLIGPVLSLLFTLGKTDDWYKLGLLLGLYALIAVLDGLLIQPLLLHRTTRVPWWAALLGPIVLGVVIPFWGVLLAPPLLAVIFAFRRKGDTAREA